MMNTTWILSLSASALIGLASACSTPRAAQDEQKAQPSAPSEGDVAEPVGHLSLAEPVLAGTTPGLTQIKLVVSNSSGTAYSASSPYASGDILVAKGIATGSYKIYVEVSTNGSSQYKGEAAVAIAANQTTKAEVQLQTAGATSGGLAVKILPPGEQSACTVYQTMANRPQTMACELNSYTCTWTSGSGQVFSAGPINCGANPARLALLKQLCQQSQTLTQAEADTTIKCAVAR